MSLEKIRVGGVWVELEIPDNIVNKLAYVEWSNLKKLLENHPDTYFVTTRKNRINLKGLWSVCEKQILKDGELTKDQKKYCRDKNTWFKGQYQTLQKLEKQFFSLDGRIKANPILEDKKSDLMELFGKWHTVKDVFDIVNKEWGMKTSFAQVQTFFVQNKVEIIKLRQDKEVELGEISLTSKKSRLQELNFLLQDRKNIYRAKHLREDSVEIRHILRQAKEEVEGEKLSIDISGQINIEVTLQTEYQNEVLRALTLNQIILSRVAARLQINPLYLQSRLVSSIYAKFSGFVKNDEMYSEQPIYPSSMVYDFDNIKTIAHIKKKELEEAQIIPERKDSEDASAIKSRLLLLIKKKNKELQESKESLNDVSE